MTSNGQPVARGPADAVTRLANALVRWAPDGKRLAAIGQPGSANGYIWIIEPAGAVPFRKLIDLPPDSYVHGATWMKDGSALVIGQARSTSDIILAERLR